MATADRPPARSTRDRPSKAPLSDGAVLDAALGVLRREGIDAVTMRRVAKELDTGAASLYVYVQGHDELLRLLFDRVASGVALERSDPARWRDQLRALCVAMLEALEAHPGIARVALAQPPMGDNSLACAEALFDLLLMGGVQPQRAAWACDVIFLLITANAVETDVVREREATGQRPFDEGALRRTFEELPAARYPQLSAHAVAMTSGSHRERFVFGIDTFVDGLLR